MAVDLGSLVSEVKEQVELEELSGKIIAIDAYNAIYQFLSIIRGPDGTPLTDSKGRVTSHLSGLFYRTVNLLEKRIIPVYVFDGVPPALKQRTIEARMSRRKEAKKAWEEAVAKGMMEEARTHAMASTRINREIVASGKELLGYMGVPFLQAPSEGEGQAAQMTRDGLVYAVGSQDYDSFLFGAKVIIRNLTLSGRRKLPGRNVYVNVNIERSTTDALLKKFGVSQRMFIMMGALIGTDFNTGVEKVGPKTALKIVKEHKTEKKVAAYVKEKYGVDIETELSDVLNLFEKPEVEHMTEEKFQALRKGFKPDREKLMKFMCEEHQFSPDRIEKYADKIFEIGREHNQKGINKWLE